MFGQDDKQASQWQPTTNQFDAPTGAPLPEPTSTDAPDMPGVTFGATPADPPTVADPTPVTPVATDTPPATTEVSTPATPVDSALPSDDLLKIKQAALEELTPLVGHLEQSPEEKFRTTMMMIQASDDHSMLQTAYEAAKLITDEKARAQALLDVINEINYFTQQHQS